MYDITPQDFLLIREEALHPTPDEGAYAVTFSVMEQMFPGYLYARRASFPCEEDLEDCLMTAQIRIVERIRRYYFEREDMEQTPESLQRWMFTVLKNCHYTQLRQSEAGQNLLQRMELQARSDMGLTASAEGKLNADPIGTEGSCDGGFDALFRREEIKDRRQLLQTCFAEILNGRSEVQILLAWLSVSALMLVKDMKKKDAIARIAEADPTMEQLFRFLIKLLAELPWLELSPRDLEPLVHRLNTCTEDGRSLGALRFGDFTAQTPKEYISKTINKRNDALSSRHRWDEIDL